MQYFTRDYLTLAEIKADYRILSKKHHPDLGGSDEIFKIIGLEYEQLLHLFVHNMYTTQSEKVGKEFKFDDFQYVAILRKILTFDIEIDIIGTWIYAFKSIDYRTQLKELGFFFSGKHKAWIYNGGFHGRYSKNKLTTDDVKDKWGSIKVNTKTNYLHN